MAAQALKPSEHIDTITRVMKVISVFCFLIFLITCFFGTSMPFSERVEDVNEYATSNPVNQIVFGMLFVFSIITLIPKWKFCYTLLKKEIFLALFLTWCFLTIFWSDFPFVSFKRLFQLSTSILVCQSILIYADSLDEILKYFKYVLCVYLFLSIISVFFVSGATDPSAGTWRGFAASKNLLGQATLVCLVIWINIVFKDTLFNKAIAIPMILIALILLIGSHSMTSLLTFIMILLISGFFYAEHYLFAPLHIGRYFSILVITSSILIVIIAFSIAPEFMRTLPEYVGKDATFTGRSDLWFDVLSETRHHWLKGCGFASFWFVENPRTQFIYEIYVWLPRQAHSGYIDIVNELGIIGLGLFSLIIIHFYKNLIKYKEIFFWGWFMAIGLVINIQETTFLKARYLTGIMPLFAYLALFIQQIKDETLSL